MENLFNKEENIKVLVKKVGQDPVEKTIKNDLEPLQEIVGGNIECVGLGNNIALVLNEEGKLINLKPNFMLGVETIVGDCLFVKTDFSTGEFVSLDDKEIKQIKESFKKLEG